MLIQENIPQAVAFPLFQKGTPSLAIQCPFCGQTHEYHKTVSWVALFGFQKTLCASGPMDIFILPFA